MRRFAFLILFLAAPAYGQSVTLPKTVTGSPGEWLVIPAEWDGGIPEWWIADAGIEEVPIGALLGPEAASHMKGRVFKTSKGVTAGRFRVVAYNAKGDKASKLSVCEVVIGESPEPPGPGPGPQPPGPGPTPDPDPFLGAGGIRGPPGLKVLVLYESADISKMPHSQVSILTSGAVRDYLISHCLKEGSTAAWRFWDRNVDPANESAIWKAAFNKADKLKVPVILIGDGKRGYVGPLPADIDSTLALLKKFGG